VHNNVGEKLAESEALGRVRCPQTFTRPSRPGNHLMATWPGVEPTASRS